MIGQQLRAAREAKGLTLEDVERVTRIRARYLIALEADDFAALPSDIQARGFLHNYAQFLGLPVTALVANYAKLTGRKSILPLPAAPTKAQSRPASASTVTVRARGWRFFSADVLVAIIISVALGLLLLWGSSQILAGAGAEATGTPTASSTAPAGLTPTATSPAVEVAPTQPFPTPLLNYTGVHVLIRAEERLWVRVWVDGVETFAGLLPPGESKEFVGQNVIELATGNGKGTRVIWNGVDQGTLGDVGEVVARLWTLDGMVIPTPTITPTPTATTPPTRTPNP
jgi:transcriptional regulator with XRE-family HTH domain